MRVGMPHSPQALSAVTGCGELGHEEPLPVPLLPVDLAWGSGPFMLEHNCSMGQDARSPQDISPQDRKALPL